MSDMYSLKLGTIFVDILLTSLSPKYYMLCLIRYKGTKGEVC